jgi:pyridoxal phosphate enzyme (YggS family)
MCAVRIGGRRQRRIVGDNPFETPFARQAGDQNCQRNPVFAFARPQHDKASARQREDCRTQIGDALVVRHQHQRGQYQPRGATERVGRSCQLLARKAIRHPMSSPDQAALPAAERLADILARIEAARKAALAPAPSTTLVAVSKTFGADEIAPVIAAGQRIFGENRVQEAKAKWPALKEQWPGVVLHLVGPLQSNKAHEAIELFDAIHSIDRPKIAESLRHEIDKAGRAPLLFIQVNTGEEPQKAGVAPQDAPQFIDHCRETLALPIFGLMCIPPAEESPAPHFALLAKIARAHGLEGLSMGMSADFETAIRFGATHVRVGTAVFGHRERPT